MIAGIRHFGREAPGGQQLLTAPATGYDYTRIEPSSASRTVSRPTNVIEPDAGLITAVKLTTAFGPENHEGALRARLIGLDTMIAGNSVASWPVRPAVEVGFTLDHHFTVDETAGGVICPNGLTRPSPLNASHAGRRLRRLPIPEPMHHRPAERNLDLQEHDALQRQRRQRPRPSKTIPAPTGRW